MVLSNAIDPYVLAQDVISRFAKQNGVYPCFEHLMHVNSGLTAFSSAQIKFAVYEYNEHTEALVNRLADVFESVFGKRPTVTVYVPYKPPQGESDGS